jgi:hypothetical protein
MSGCSVSVAVVRSNVMVVGAASMLFHRFFTFQSFKNHDRKVRLRSYDRHFVTIFMQMVAMACLLLASKVEESQGSLRKILEAYFEKLREKREGYTVSDKVCFDSYIQCR